MNTTSLITLWNHTQQHLGTSGAKACAQVLLGLYNGARFPMDLTDLRLLDPSLLTHALAVIDGDSRHCQREVHEWLNLLAGRRDMGQRFEALAWEYKCFSRGRCKKVDCPTGLGHFKIELIRGKECTGMIVDELYDMTVPRGMGAVRHAEMLARNAGDPVVRDAGPVTARRPQDDEGHDCLDQLD